MKFNKAVTICLLLAALLVGGAFFASAAGFVTYEDNNKIILWDNVKLVNQGLNFPSTAIIEGGNINLGTGKDLFIRKFMGFDCPANYPINLICATILGDIGGNTFLKINQISNSNLTISAQQNINLSGISIDIGRADKPSQLILGGDLILTDNLPSSLPTNSVFVDYLKVNEIDGNPNLTMPPLKLSQGAFFYTNSVINYAP